MKALACVALVFACKPSTFAYLTPPEGSDMRAGVGSLSAQVAHALDEEYRGQVERTPPPVRLAPSDGSELVLRAIDANVTIRGPLAHTELRFTFHNDEDRVREGRFAIDLPPGAALGRFAMLVGHEWREARVVARARAREVYETFLHRRVDPALLEQDLGNRFSARIFPIAARADKEIIIGYDHVVSERDPYTLALAGLPKLPRLAIKLDHDGVRTGRVSKNIAPDDFVVPIVTQHAAVAAGDAFVVRVAADPLALPAAPLERLLVLVDTSASRAPVMGRQVELVRGLVAALPAATHVSVAAFDHAVTEVYRGPASEAGAGVLRLFEHGALGASDLHAAVSYAATTGIPRVLLVGDGMATIGRPARDAAVTIAESTIVRVDAVQIGGSIDRDALAGIVAAGDQPGAIHDGRDPVRVARQLQTALGPALAITVDGATRTWPATTRGLLPSEPIFVAGLRIGRASKLVVRIGERAIELAPVHGDSKRTRRAVARAELAALTEEARDAADPAMANRAIEGLALEHELVSSQTSLLVLETDEDEREMLGPRDPAPPREPIEIDDKLGGGGGELMLITGSAPTIDPTSTTTGAVVSHRLPGRSFSAAIGTTAGAQHDKLGVSFSGSSSLENVYYVDGVNTTPIGSAGRRVNRLPALNGSGMLPFPTVFHSTREPEPEEVPRGGSPYVGQLHQVMVAISRTQRDRAVELASRWQLEQPGDVAAIIALGEAAEARGATAIAARAYGSLVDLYPNRAELLRVAGQRLDRVGARSLAVAAYSRAVRERPDQVTGHRLLAFAHFRAGEPDAALTTLLDAIPRAAEPIAAVLRQDARVIAAHLAARAPARRDELRKRAGELPARPSLHVVLSWETDANDVDLHVWDRRGRHASFREPELKSGGVLLHDLTDGFGPEMFVVERPAAFPYTIAAHYYSRGPMGLGLGTVQVIRHDGNGNVTVEDRPFVIQKDGATVELGTIR